jgi:hypothetical protein
MKVTFTADKITQADITRYLQAKLNANRFVVISFQKMKNGAWQVTFKHDGQKRSTFCSEQKILKDRYLWMREQSNDVGFGKLGDSIMNPYHVTVRSTTSRNMHSVDIQTLHCTCHDFGRLELNGKPVCKHTMSYAKKRMGINSVDQFIAAILIGLT